MARIGAQDYFDSNLHSLPWLSGGNTQLRPQHVLLALSLHSGCQEWQGLTLCLFAQITPRIFREWETDNLKLRSPPHDSRRYKTTRPPRPSSIAPMFMPPSPNHSPTNLHCKHSLTKAAVSEPESAGVMRSEGGSKHRATSPQLLSWPHQPLFQGSFQSNLPSLFFPTPALLPYPLEDLRSHSLSLPVPASGPKLPQQGWWGQQQKFRGTRPAGKIVLAGKVQPRKLPEGRGGGVGELFKLVPVRLGYGGQDT